MSLYFCVQPRLGAYASKVSEAEFEDIMSGTEQFPTVPFPKLYLEPVQVASSLCCLLLTFSFVISIGKKCR